ncbi:MAG: Catabolite control protein A [Paracidovorax wautersii]|uniref:Catabolite control protein A n=1 Tax=Paracidovorax wautersii TaxID=1177982 RepID=A0A7V8FRP3_9BURK|nr:MAG: Catabolite control protein A [Paracidovorax wautersii]
MAAGVSTATVSRVINLPERVSPEVRARVQSAIEALGWIPNETGRALASSRSRLLGLLLPTMDNEVFAHQAEGLQRVLRARGMNLLIGCSNYDLGVAYEEAQIMVGRGIEALAFVGETQDARLYELLRARALPYAVLYSWRAQAPHPCIGVDHRAAFCTLTQRLIALGHRRLGVVLQPLAHNDRVAARLDGIRDAVAAAGSACTCVFEHQESGIGIDFGEQAFNRLMARPERPTAVLCGNDELALGAFFAAQKAGIRVPHEVSLTGFDDLRVVSRLTPALTSGRVDNRRLGELAGLQLLDALDGKGTPPGAALPVEWQWRGSVAPPAS